MANTLTVSAEKKMWVAFAFSFYSKTINIFENTLATTVNEFFINELVKLMMLCTTEPWLNSLEFQEISWSVNSETYGNVNP